MVLPWLEPLEVILILENLATPPQALVEPAAAPDKHPALSQH
jgi:hypothetical protein